jgi:hypothetical protein
MLIYPMLRPNTRFFAFAVPVRSIYRCAVLAGLFLLTIPPVAAQVMAQSLPELAVTDSAAARLAQPKPAEPLTPNLTVLTGQVLDASGKPLPGATATVEGTEWLTVSDDKGTFALPVQALGSFGSIRVRCSYQGLSDQLLDVSPGVEQIIFMMKEANGTPAPKKTTTGRTRDL